MSSLGFDIGVRALLTAQTQLETIGHNLTNANTPGYSRQTTLVETAIPQTIRGLIQGGGVQTGAIQRAVDFVLQGQLARQSSSLGRLDSRIDTLTQIETLLGGTSDSGPSALLQKMFASINSLSATPDDSVLRTTTVQSAVTLTGRLNQLSGDMLDLSRGVAGQLDNAVQNVNTLAQKISVLNREIVNLEGSTSSANDLRDQRDQALSELAKYVGVKAVDNGHGAIRVLVDGRMLVSPVAVDKLQVHQDTVDGSVSLQIGGADVDISSGQVGGLLGMAQTHLPALSRKLDTLAASLIYEMNRVHSTGVGSDGPLQALHGSNAPSDENGDGNVTDELLARSHLPFDVRSGVLVVNITNRATGAVEQHQIAIDAATTTVGDFIAALDGLPHISASLDAHDKLAMQADTGYGFDFAARLDTSPDAIGSFGGGRASIGTAGNEPFALANGDTLDFVGPASSFTVTLQGTSFANIASASADELAAALNADANFQSNGLVANVVGGSLVVQTNTAGASQSFTLAGGTALGALGWTAGTVVSGSDVAATPHISGRYTGASNGTLTFRPNMDGSIGTTPGLMIDVFDSSGNRVTQLDVGPNYHPGDKLDVVDGVQVSFDYGAISASHNDVFQLDVIADSDSAHVLPALGLNGLFTGHDAGSIDVRADIAADPSLLAASLTGAPGDAGNLLRMLAVESKSLAGFDNASIGEGLPQVVGDVAFDLDSANSARSSEQQLADSLTSRRDAISGVNTDEELAHMVEQQQAYSSAAQYLKVLNDLSNELMNIL
jgi:flagellar hook-associated protein FlgK